MFLIEIISYCQCVFILLEKMTFEDELHLLNNLCHFLVVEPLH